MDAAYEAAVGRGARAGVEPIRTERLILRGWRDSDRGAFADLNADPRVMRHFPATLTREESDALADRIRRVWDEAGYGLYAVEIPGEAEFAGFVGLGAPSFSAPFVPCVEIGWRLAARFHGRGYATEAARAVLARGFDLARTDEIVSFTAEGNVASRRVMEKIGMTRDPADDFDHPALPDASPLRRHVLYRIRRGARTSSVAID